MGELVVIKDGQPTVIKSDKCRNLSGHTEYPVDLFLRKVLPENNYRLGKVAEDEYFGVNFVFFREKKPSLPLGCLATRGAAGYVELWVFRSGKSLIEEIVGMLEVYSRKFGNVTLNIYENY
jgi:hypothetical protein